MKMRSSAIRHLEMGLNKSPRPAAIGNTTTPKSEISPQPPHRKCLPNIPSGAAAKPIATADNVIARYFCAPSFNFSTFIYDSNSYSHPFSVDIGTFGLALVKGVVIARSNGLPRRC